MVLKEQQSSEAAYQECNLCGIGGLCRRHSEGALFHGGGDGRGPLPEVEKDSGQLESFDLGGGDETGPGGDTSIFFTP